MVKTATHLINCGIRNSNDKDCSRKAKTCKILVLNYILLSTPTNKNRNGVSCTFCCFVKNPFLLQASVLAYSENEIIHFHTIGIDTKC